MEIITHKLKVKTYVVSIIFINFALWNDSVIPKTYM